MNLLIITAGRQLVEVSRKVRWAGCSSGAHRDSRCIRRTAALTYGPKITTGWSTRAPQTPHQVSRGSRRSGRVTGRGAHLDDAAGAADVVGPAAEGELSPSLCWLPQPITASHVVPVYWHRIHASNGTGGVVSDSQVAQQITVLNNAYASSSFSFSSFIKLCTQQN